LTENCALDNIKCPSSRKNEIWTND